MAGVQIHIRPEGVDAINRYLSTLARSLGVTAPLLDAVGGVVESQTRRRLSEEKEGPDGQPWPDWSPDYARTRKRGQRLLESEGELLDSIHYELAGDVVMIGSGLVYAAIHQFGGAEAGQPGLPARPFLGLGADDELEILEVLTDFGRAAMDRAAAAAGGAA